MKSEARIQKEILGYLEERMINDRDLYVTRCHAGHAFRNQYTHIRLAPTGSPDIIVAYNGTMVGIEVKKKGGRQSEEQKMMEIIINNSGNEYHIVYSLQDVKDLLEKTPDMVS